MFAKEKAMVLLDGWPMEEEEIWLSQDLMRRIVRSAHSHLQTLRPHAPTPFSRTSRFAGWRCIVDGGYPTSNHPSFTSPLVPAPPPAHCTEVEHLDGFSNAMKNYI